MCIFVSWQFYGDHKRTQSVIPFFTWTVWKIGALIPAEAPCACPYPQYLDEFGKPLLILRSPMLADELEFYVMVEQVASPPASWKVLERGVFERYCGIFAQLKDNGGLVERY